MINDIRRNIKTIITEKGLKQRKIAELVGMNEKKFSNILSGRAMLKSDDILSIAIALDVTPNDLFGFSKSA